MMQGLKIGVRWFAIKPYYFERQVTVMPDFNTKISKLPLKVKVKKLKMPVRMKQLP
jgi:hypothetical protein